MDRWEYLVTKEYLLRHHIAEYFLSDVDFTIDVGAYKRTLYGAYPYNVIAIDPLKTMVDSYHGTVAEWFTEYSDILNDNYGVMALGLEIEGEEKEWNAFISLIEGSRIAILEHSIEHEPSIAQFNQIMSTTKKELITLMDIEFCNVQTSGFVPHKKRRLVVLERK